MSDNGEIERSRHDGKPVLIDGEPVSKQTGIADGIMRSLLRRGLDPELMQRHLTDPEPLQDPRGNIMTRDEAVEWFTETGLVALRRQAAGEFALDRLPALDTYVAQWFEQHCHDPHAAPLLMLQGIIGCGKTSQALALQREIVLWNARQARRYVWLFVTHRTLAAEVQPGPGRDPDRIVQELMDADGVVIDDIGDFNAEDFGRAASATSRIINYRAHHHKTSIFTSNLPYDRTPELAAAERELGERIAVLRDFLDPRAISRLRGGWTVALPEIDYRAAQGRTLGQNRGPGR